MSNFYIMALLLAAAGLFRPITGRGADQQLSERADAEIRKILKDQETAWNKHDMVAFTKAFREDAEGINVAGMYWQGKSALLKHLTEFHATFLKNCQEYLEDVQVHSIGEGYVVAVNIWKVDAFMGPGGREFPACRHRSTVLFAKRTDGWKIVHFHNTTIDETAVKVPGFPHKQSNRD